MSKLKFLTIAFLIGTFTATALKSNAIQKVYDTFEDSDEIMALSFSKQMTDFLDADAEWGDEMKYIQGDVNKVSTLIVSENSDSRKNLSKIKNMIEDLGYRQIELPEEEKDEFDDSEVYIYAKGKKGRYDEIHMLVMDDDDDSGVLVSIFGDITITDEKQ